MSGIGTADARSGAAAGRSDGSAKVLRVLRVLLQQLEETQWTGPEALARWQFQQLEMLLAHCEPHSPQLRRRLQAAGLQRDELLSAAGLRRLPPLRRREAQAANDWFCTELPEGHGPTEELSTSGSIGEPVRFLRTQVNQFDWFAYGLRKHLWAQRDFRSRVCAIRAGIFELAAAPGWGPPVSLLFDSGPTLAVPATTPLTRQLELLRDFAPNGLVIYPSNLAGLLCAMENGATGLGSIRDLRTMGETLTPELRAQARRLLGVEIEDAYSSNEFGYIALQCPAAPLYHVMAESLIVELLDEHGEPCRTGEVGRVVITDLHNYATPFIRYDIGDYAEAGPPCPCGRGLPTLRSIRGRERNLIRMPDGSRNWPLVGFIECRNLAPVIQYQLVQTAPEAVEVRLVTERPLTPDEESRLGAQIQHALGFAFALRFVYYQQAIPRGANGKFEEFICQLA